MKLKPLGDRLIVKAVDEEETTASGIVLPDTAKEKPQRGKVLPEGPLRGVGVRRSPWRLVGLACGMEASGTRVPVTMPALPERLVLLVSGKQGIAPTGAEIGGQGRMADGKLREGHQVLLSYQRERARHKIGMAKHAILLDGLRGQGE